MPSASIEVRFDLGPDGASSSRRGPARPREAGYQRPLAVSARHAAAGIPLFGVCLGHQAIGEAFGGKVIRADRPHAWQDHHGRSHGGPTFFPGPPPRRSRRCDITRWWLRAQGLPAGARGHRMVRPIARQAPRSWGFPHRSLPVYGVQFHPESGRHGPRKADPGPTSSPPLPLGADRGLWAPAPDGACRINVTNRWPSREAVARPGARV